MVSSIMPDPVKTLYTLNIGNYAPAVRALTYPLMKNYARKIRARFVEITERKFPDWPVVYEKLQIHELGRGSDWNIFVDADAMIHPEMFDVTEHLTKDTVCHNGRDMAGVRWTYDSYFRRDGRHWGSCNWFTIGSDWCLDLWRPLDDLTLEEAAKNINITVGERISGCCKTEHLIDDYTLSRNIARFGLKSTTIVNICEGLGMKGPDGRGISPWLFHLYAMSEREKIEKYIEVLRKPMTEGGWQLMSPEDEMEFRKQWGL